MLGLTLIIFLLFSNSFIFEEVARIWELPSKKNQELDKYKYGVVLGGMAQYDIDNERINFLSGIDRLLQAIDLYKAGIIEKIIITGGSSRLINNEIRESDYIIDYMVRIGIPAEDIIKERESRNTYENALNTAQILKDSINSQKILLITSGWHMRRSIGCFKKQGFSFDIFPTNRISGPRKFFPDHLLVPSCSALGGWEMLFHEISGYIAYKIKGYI